MREVFGDRMQSLEMTRREYVVRADSPRRYRELFSPSAPPLSIATSSIAPRGPTADRPRVPRSTAGGQH